MKFINRLPKFVAVVTLIAIAGSSCQKVMEFTPNPKATQKKSITRLVSQTPNLSLLEAAVIRAGLADVLDKPGTYTVFAPTDEAFRAAGLGSVDAINQVPADALQKIILYHALGSEVKASDVQGLSSTAVETLNGADFYVTGMNGNVCVNGAKVVLKDIQASNGEIHVIDRVLLPPSKNIVELAQSNPDLNILVQAVVKAGAVDLLSGDGPYTVFAPTNKAFEDLLSKLGASSLDDIPNDVLLNVLKYHLIGARVFSCNLSEGLTPTTLEGSTLTVSLQGGATVKGNSNTTPSNITSADILATNGVVHVIDQVLLP